MPQTIKTGMVVGTAKPRVWSQVVTEKISSGAVLVLVNLVYSGESDVIEVAAVGAEILESAKTQLSASQIDLPGMKRVISKLVSEVGVDLKLSIVGARARGGELVIAGRGEVEVSMSRGEKMGKIFVGTNSTTGVVGEVKGDDVFVLSTRELVRVAGEEILAQSLSKESKLEQLAVVVHGEENSSMLASVLGRGGGRGEEPVMEKEMRVEKKRKRRKIFATSRMSSFWQKIRNKPMVIRQEQKKMNLKVGVFLLVLLVVGVGVGVVSRSRVVRENEYKGLQSVVESKLNEAGSIADLNPERAKDLLLQAEGEVESYLGMTPDEEYRVRAQELVEQIMHARARVFRQEQIEITTLIEQSVLSVSGVEKIVDDKNGSVVVVDERNKRLVGVSVEDRSTWEVELGDVGVIKSTGFYGNNGYFVTAEGVSRVELASDEVRQVIEKDDLWGEIVEIGMFGGNVYLLDTGNGEIWKYPALTDGFGARRRWLGAGIVLDLSKVVDMAGDGDIWILTSSGKLERYSRGVPVTFSMEGFPAEEFGRLVDPKAVAMSEEKVYVLEAGVSRVVVFDKESGRYEKQLVNEEFSSGKDMVVMEDKGYVLTGDRVVEFGL